MMMATMIARIEIISPATASPRPFLPLVEVRTRPMMLRINPTKAGSPQQNIPVNEQIKPAIHMPSNSMPEVVAGLGLYVYSGGIS